MSRPAMHGDLVVLHTKLTTYLPWSQPFLYDFLVALGRHAQNVIVCSHTENLSRFPLPDVVTIPPPCLVHPAQGLLAASYLRRRWRPSIIHAHFGFSGLHSLVLKQLLNVPLVVTFGGRDATAHMALPRLRPLYELLLRSADRLVAVSSELRDQLVSAGAAPENVDVIRRGTDLKKFAAITRDRDGADEPVTLLMVGRLVEKKGHRYALQAVARLVREGVRICLVIVGDGALAREVRRHARALSLDGAVEFTGACPQDEVRRHLARADILVHCSVTGRDGDREGVPNAVVEAAATGLPVVATRHGGIVEVVKDEETGCLVAERDVDGLAAAIRRLARSRDLRRRFGEAGALLAHGQFDADRQVRRHVDVYRELIQSHREAPVWLPADFPQQVVASMTGRRHAGEYSVVDLAAWLWRPQRFRFTTATCDYGADTDRIARLRVAGGRLPPPVKNFVRGAMASLIRYRETRGLGLGGADGAALDRAALAFVARGGDLSQIDQAWSLAALQAFLRADAAASGAAQAR